MTHVISPRVARCAALPIVLLASLLAPGVSPAAVQTKTAPDTRVAASLGASPGRAGLADRAQRLAAAAGGAIVDDVGCTSNVLGANDDGSTGLVSLPFALNFFGQSHTSLYVNNNGNVTFNAPLGTYTPYVITASVPPIIAPFFADVDTRGIGSGLTTYGTTTFQGHTAFCVNWLDVGYFSNQTDKLNSFQLLLVDRSDAAPGDFDIIFNYGQLTWETGSASGGSGGFGGTSAGAGYSNGDGDAAHFFQMPGSLVHGALLDSASTGLIHVSEGSSTLGRYVFHVTSNGQTDVSLDGLARDWPSESWGYKFANRGLVTWLSQTTLALGDVYTDGTLSSLFSDWGRYPSATRAQQIHTIFTIANGGLCFGMALSAGRFDELVDSLPGPGRTDSLWATAGSGPYATMHLATPGLVEGATTTYNREMVRLLALDWASQLSTQVAGSMQRQFNSYADRTSGVRALAEQVSDVMRNGHDRYDVSGRIAGAPGSGFAMISVFDSDRQHAGGHELLAYSAQRTETGGIKLGVWDNNFPRQPHTITINAHGTWTYDAHYNNGFLSGTLSMSGAGGRQGRIAVLPLFAPSGLTYAPTSTGGLGTGTFVDVPAGTDVTDISDSAGEEPEVQYIAGGDPDDPYAGQMITLPSDAGTVTVDGDHPQLDVRGEHTTMSATGDQSGPLDVSTDEQQGTIGVDGAAAQLTVARDALQVKSTGAGALTLGDDGSVHADGLAGQVKLTADFDDAAGNGHTATLFDGQAPVSGTVTVTSAQVHDAQQAALTPPRDQTPPPSQSQVQPPAGPPPVVHGASTPVKKAVKPLTRAQKLAKAIKACKKLKSKTKRTKCVTAAKKRYAPKSTAKKKPAKKKTSTKKRKPATGESPVKKKR
jgi:hypothetical protein